MRTIFIFIFVILTTSSLKAQYYGNETNDSIIWVDNYMHDFGEVLEGLQIQHTYRLKNLSKDTLKIIHIDQFGGSGLFSASHENIFPGSYFLVDVSFSTSGKNGNFIKQGTINFSNGLKIVLGFKGYILDKKLEIDNSLKIISDKEISSIIWVDNDVYNFGVITEGETVKHAYKLRNLSKDTITILNNQIENNLLSVFSKKPILPNETFEYSIIFNTEGKAGFQRRRKKINFSNGSFIECNFEGYVNQFPIIEPLFQFDSMFSGMKTYDFGYINEGSQVKFEYVYKNTSKDTLYIENTSTECGCHFCTWSREPILPNQYFKVINHFNASGKSGSQSKNANMRITNKKGYYKNIYINFTAFVVEQCKQEDIYYYPQPIRNK